MIKIIQILGIRSQNNTRTSVILRQEFVNNFARLTQAPIILPLRHGRFDFALVNALVPSPFPRKI